MCVGQINLTQPDEPELRLQKTRFGWVIGGSSNSQTATNTFHASTTVLQADLARFWEIDEGPSIKHLSETDRRCEEHFQTHVRRTSEGRYNYYCLLVTGAFLRYRIHTVPGPPRIIGVGENAQPSHKAPSTLLPGLAKSAGAVARLRSNGAHSKPSRLTRTVPEQVGRCSSAEGHSVEPITLTLPSCQHLGYQPLPPRVHTH